MPLRPQPGAPTAPEEGATFQMPDYYGLDDTYSEQEKAVRQKVRRFVDDEVLPVIEEHAQNMTFPRHLVAPMAELGLLGPTLPEEYGGRGHDSVTYGLMMQEIERGDSSLRSFCSVQSALVMYPIYRYGSEEQKQTWLPAMARGEKIGSFALTEPDHGSNPAGIETRAARDGDEYVLNGHKRWSTNASEGDVSVVWARDEEGEIRGFLVELDREGVSTPRIGNKWSLRAAVTSEVVLEDVRIPAANRLPGASGLKAPLSCLSQARFGIAWGVLGAAAACYDAALRHARQRKQFDRPIARFQLIQDRLVDMVEKITKGQLLVRRLAELKDAGSIRPQQISMAKRNNCRMALEVARSARQVLGGNGVLGDHPVMRHMMNLESVITYEGTHEVQTLIIGQDVTGERAFV